jgi:hypothetical protein
MKAVAFVTLCLVGLAATWLAFVVFTAKLAISDHSYWALAVFVIGIVCFVLAILRFSKML